MFEARESEGGVTMKFFSGILFGMFLVGLLVAGVLATGAYNVAATSAPSKTEAKLAAWALNRSVARHATRAHNPLPESPATWRAGLAHYKENCVVCHGAPGVDAAELGQGLNPAAPDLTLPRVQARPDGELFWIVSNGIRTTGMPAFSPTHKPEEIWQIVSFVRHLEGLTADEQKTLKSVADEEAQHHEAAPADAGHAPDAPAHP
jgi:mono/diheme cytochrome c family protein